MARKREGAENLSTESAFEGKELKFNDLVEVIGTGTSSHIKEGEKHVVHRMHAETLERKGYVTIGDSVEVESRRVSVEKERKTTSR